MIDENSCFDQQYNSNFRNTIANSLYNYFSDDNMMIPLDTASIVSRSISNIITGALSLGTGVVQTKMMKDVEIVKSFERTYGITINAVLKYLCDQKLIEKEHQKQCFQFYEKYCSDMTAKEKIEFMSMENQFSMKKQIIGAIKAFGSLAIMSIGAFATAKVLGDTSIQKTRDNSKYYQKTERMRIKYDHKK